MTDNASARQGQEVDKRYDADSILTAVAASPAMKAWAESAHKRLGEVSPARLKLGILAILEKERHGSGKSILSCTPTSILRAIGRCLGWGFYPGEGDRCYLIPYGDQLEAQLSYHGMREIAISSGRARMIVSHLIRENDIFSLDMFGPDGRPVLEHKIDGPDRGKVVGAYCAVRQGDDGVDYVELMSVGEIDEIRERSSSKNSPANRDHPDQMRLKVVTKRAMKHWSSMSPGTERTLESALDADDEPMGPVIDMPRERA